MPPQDEIQAPCEGAAEDQGEEHPGAREHTRAPGGSGREAFRGLGDGPDSREGAEERNTHPVREEPELHADGAPAEREEPRRRRREGRRAAVAVQEERPDHNHRQRRRVLAP